MDENLRNVFLKNQTNRNILPRPGCVCGQPCGYKCITDEVGWARAKVFSTDGDFSPSCSLLGRDARDQRGLTGTRHGGLRQTGTLSRSTTGKKDRQRQAYIRGHGEKRKTQQTPYADSSVYTCEHLIMIKIPINLSIWRKLMKVFNYQLIL